MAHLRLVRGNGSSFIADCVEALAEAGAAGVLSSPLPRSAQKSWRDAEFEPHASLALMRRRLGQVPPQVTSCSRDVRTTCRKHYGSTP